MNEKEIFLILGIEPTREEEKIKAAYRNQLVKVNPEENAEGFKEVRRHMRRLYVMQKSQ